MLTDHRIVVTGVLTDDSLAFGIARRAIDEGAQVIITGAGRSLSLTRRVARKLGDVGDVIPLDVTSPAEVASAVESVRDRVGRLDGLVHSIGFAPESAIGHGMFHAPFEDVATALHVSTYSFAALVGAFRPLLALSTAPGGASVVGLDFDGMRAYPKYDWMGVAKAGLESVNRYVAREVGADAIRTNLLAAGPVRTLAARSIPGFDDVEALWATRAPLGWDVRDAGAVFDTAICLLSPLMRGTTGSIVYVDGGAHAMA
jgi:enoyl-[acyl-carrier protein] reductase I